MKRLILLFALLNTGCAETQVVYFPNKIIVYSKPEVKIIDRKNIQRVKCRHVYLTEKQKQYWLNRAIEQ